MCLKKKKPEDVKVNVLSVDGGETKAFPPTVSIEKRIDEIREIVEGNQTSIQLNQRNIKWTQIGIVANIAITFILFVVNILLQHSKVI